MDLFFFPHNCDKGGFVVDDPRERDLLIERLRAGFMVGKRRVGFLVS
ncbi:hypothetical protein [Pajaroellobacter abortibovis]|nr:hypothetical protein [Pajaroellobacter abortibovis]